MNLSVGVTRCRIGFVRGEDESESVFPAYNHNHNHTQQQWIQTN